MASCPTDIDCRPAPCPPAGARRAAARLPRQGLRELPPAAARPAPARSTRMDRAQPVRPRHRAARAARLRRATTSRYFQDAVANEAYLDTLAHADLGAAPRAARRLPDARRPQRVGAVSTSTVNVAGDAARAGRRSSRGSPRRSAAQAPPPGPARPAGRADRRRARSAIPPSRRRRASRRRTRRRSGPARTTRSASTRGATRSAASPPARPRRTSTRSTPGRRPSAPAARGRRLRRSSRSASGPRTGATPTPTRPTASSCGSRARRSRPTDPLYARTLVAGVAASSRSAGDPALPLLRVRWRRADALGFPLCLSARLRDGTLVRDVSVARGNVVLADHGLTTEETQTPGRADRRRAPAALPRRR